MNYAKKQPGDFDLGIVPLANKDPQTGNPINVALFKMILQSGQHPVMGVIYQVALGNKYDALGEDFVKDFEDFTKGQTVPIYFDFKMTPTGADVNFFLKS